MSERVVIQAKKIGKIKNPEIMRFRNFAGTTIEKNEAFQALEKKYPEAAILMIQSLDRAV